MVRHKKIRVLCSPITVIVSILVILFMCGFHVFSLINDAGRELFLEETPLFILWTLETWGLSVALILTGARRIFSIITIDEYGISRSFLGKYYKLHISWDDMTEICYKENVWPFLFFSKTKKLSEMEYNKAIKVKDAIQLSFSKKRYKIISHFTRQPIIGMPDKIKDKLSRNQ